MHLLQVGLPKSHCHPPSYQERAGVKMILIQDGSQPPNMDKPLRIIGDPYKVQVHTHTHTHKLVLYYA